ncbi:hypothetical protein Hanom_Chr12g01168101 [Helianthus anomalus]
MVSATVNGASGANATDVDMLISFAGGCGKFELRLRDLGQGLGWIMVGSTLFSQSQFFFVFFIFNKYDLPFTK